MSEAYKVERLIGHLAEDPRLTQAPKKAALCALAVMAFRPLRLVQPNVSPRQYLSVYANQTLSMQFAGSVLQESFLDLTVVMERRLFNFLNGAGMTCLAEYTRVQQAGQYQSIYAIDITPDLPQMDMLILFFEQNWKQRPGRRVA